MGKWETGTDPVTRVTGGVPAWVAAGKPVTTLTAAVPSPWASICPSATWITRYVTCSTKVKRLTFVRHGYGLQSWNTEQANQVSYNLFGFTIKITLLKEYKDIGCPLDWTVKTKQCLTCAQVNTIPARYFPPFWKHTLLAAEQKTWRLTVSSQEQMDRQL